METHKENRTKYECEQCHLSYTRKDSLLRHVRSHSKAQNTPVVIITAKKTQIYHCEKCDYNTTTKRYLVRHNKEVHESKDSKSFACDICESTFTNSGNLSRHKMLLWFVML